VTVELCRTSLEKWREGMTPFINATFAKINRLSTKPDASNSEFVVIHLGTDDTKVPPPVFESSFSKAMSFSLWQRYFLSKEHPTVLESSFGVFIRGSDKLTGLGINGEWARYDYERMKQAYPTSHLHLGNHKFHLPLGSSLFRPSFENVVLAAAAEAERLGLVDDEDALENVRATSAKSGAKWEVVQARRAARRYPKQVVDELLRSGTNPVLASMPVSEVRRLRSAVTLRQRTGGRLDKPDALRLLNLLSQLELAPDDRE
jgi:hypothetical protein